MGQSKGPSPHLPIMVRRFTLIGRPWLPTVRVALFIPPGPDTARLPRDVARSLPRWTPATSTPPTASRRSQLPDRGVRAERSPREVVGGSRHREIGHFL